MLFKCKIINKIIHYANTSVGNLKPEYCMNTSLAGNGGYGKEVGFFWGGKSIQI